MKIIKTNSENTDFKNLVHFLDAELAERDGNLHEFYHQFNAIHLLNNCIVAYVDEKPVGIGAIKKYDEKTAEVKRMFVPKEFRGKGFASKILKDLESWAEELGYANCILETGIKQPEAISLYKKSGYRIIDNYGQYKDMETSVCFHKNITKTPDE